MNATKIAAWAAGSSVALLSALAGYLAHGPFGSEPIVLTVPDSVMGVVCGEAWGCYRPVLPDLIVLSATGAQDDATLPHEMLHYAHPGWTECEVSNYLFETTGLTDGYYVNGVC